MTLGENCLVSVQRDCNLENCDGTDVEMGVAATLPELSELTLNSCIYIQLDNNRAPVNIFSDGPSLYRKTNDKTQMTAVWKSV